MIPFKNLLASFRSRRQLTNPGRTSRRRQSLTIPVAAMIERLEIRQVLSAAEFHLLALIYPNIEDTGTPVSIDEATLNALVKGVQIELPTLVRQLAGDQIQVRVHVEVVDRVLQARSDGLVFDSEVEPDLSEFTKSGWYDHVLVLHGNKGGGFNGACCAYPRPGMTMSTIALSPSSGKLGNGDVPGMLHEWVHALDHDYFDVHGVPSGTDPAGDPLRLHSAETFGYTSETENRPGWSAWYGDYLTDHIRNLHSDGADTGLGLGPDAWAFGVPRDDVPYTSGSPLSLPDVSDSGFSFLSDIYWASAKTAWGTVQRDATVDNNPIKINGVQYSKGVGIHANGQIHVNLRGQSERFQADIGVDDDTPVTAGSVIFKIYGDGRLLFESAVMTGADNAAHLDIDVVGVNQLRLEVEDAGDGINSDHGVWANAIFKPFRGEFISDVGWLSSSAGYGSIELDKTIERNDIQINGVLYGKGVGMHANGEIVIPLDGKYGTFKSAVGIDDDVSSGGSVSFEVYTDGRLAFASGRVTSSDPARLVDVDVTGVQKLRLVVTDAGDGINNDHAVWGGARLTRATGFTIMETGGSTQVAESGTTDTFTVALSTQPTSSVVITVSSGDTGEATVSPTSLTFTNANWNTARTVTVTGINDSLVDGSQTTTITLSVNDGLSDDAFDAVANQTVTATTMDDDTVITVAIAPANVAEDGMPNLVYTFTRAGVTTSALTVNFTVSGTATLVTDYVQTGAAKFSATAGTVSFAAGQTTKTVTINPTTDTTIESDEKVILTVTPTSAYFAGTANSATVTITNDDFPKVTIAVAPASVLENGTPNAVYTFTRTGPTTSELTANFTVGGTATFNTDYSASGAVAFWQTAGSVTFSAGQATKTVTLDPTGDRIVEAHETVIVGVAAGSGYTVGAANSATATITNDDTEVSISVSPSSVKEDGTPNLDYTFKRVGATTTALTANFTVGGTARFSTDYVQSGTATFTASAGTVSFAAGQSTKTVTINPMADTTVEPDETVVLTITPAVAYSVGTASSATGTITNDDTSLVTPSVPTGTAASDGSYSDKILVTWTGNSRATSYEVWRSTSNNSAVAIRVADNVGSLTYDDESAIAGTTYYFLVKAKNSAGTSGFSNSDAGNRAVSSASKWVYASDLYFDPNSPNGWGPVERDHSNGETGSADGQTLTLDGVTYAKGLGAHSYSSVNLNLDGRYTRFETKVGVDDESGPNGSVVFRILGDGTELYNSGMMRGTSLTQFASVDTTGVRQLQLVVEDAGDGGNSDHADWADAKLVLSPSAGSTVFASDMVFASSPTSGSGPVERDLSNGETKVGDGHLISIEGQQFTKGLGTHSFSRIDFNLSGRFSSFQSYVGIDDETGPNGSVVFHIFSDGHEVFNSGVMTGTMSSKLASVDLIGVQALSLMVTDAGDGNNYDHADWAEARFLLM